MQHISPGPGSDLYAKAHLAKSPRDTFDLFSRAAAMGHARSMSEVGVCYLHGTGVPHSVKKAAIWFRKAADLNDHGGMFNLALAYSKGSGVPYDIDKAIFYFDKCAALGDRNARGKAAALRAGHGTTLFHSLGMMLVGKDY